ncbi:MAG: NAD(P)-binding domain-containing protein, partial [Coprobacillus sp.]
MKVAVIGTGSWGTALAQVLADNKNDVVMYGVDTKQVEDINNGYNHDFFEGLKINEDIKATSNLNDALDGAKVILLAVPTKVTALVLKEIKPLLKEENKVYFVNASKGFDPNTNDRMSNTIRTEIPSEYRHEVASIIGPSHAEEVILRMHTTIASVSLDEGVAVFVQELFS